MKNTFRFAVVALLATVGVQQACNKPKSSSIVEGVYSFFSVTSYVKYSYTINPADGAIRFTDSTFLFFDEPYPTVELKSNGKYAVSFLQQIPAPADTFEFKKVNLTLDRGGTVLQSEGENGKILSGLVLGYEMSYTVNDTAKRKLTVVRRLRAPR